MCRITAAVLVSDYSDCAQLLKCRLIVYACCKLLLLQRLHSPGCGVGCVCPTLLDKQLGSYDIRTQHGSIYLSGSSNEQVYIWQSFYTGYCWFDTFSGSLRIMLCGAHGRIGMMLQSVIYVIYWCYMLCPLFSVCAALQASRFHPDLCNITQMYISLALYNNIYYIYI